MKVSFPGPRWIRGQRCLLYPETCWLEFSLWHQWWGREPAASDLHTYTMACLCLLMYTHTQIIKYLQFFETKRTCPCQLTLHVCAVSPLCFSMKILQNMRNSSSNNSFLSSNHIYTPSVSVSSVRDNSSLFSIFIIFKRKKSLNNLALMIY